AHSTESSASPSGKTRRAPGSAAVRRPSTSALERTVLPSRTVTSTGYLRPPCIFSCDAPISKSEQTGSPWIVEGKGGPAQAVESAAHSASDSELRRRTRFTPESSCAFARLVNDLRPAELEDPVEMAFRHGNDAQARPCQERDVGELRIRLDVVERHRSL